MARTPNPIIRQTVLAATVDALEAGGFERLTIDDVALRSGVAKTTIYRHWSSKAALVVDAVASVMRPLPTPDTGDPRADLASWCDGVGGEPDHDRLASLFLTVCEAARRDEELSRLAEKFRAERQRPLHTVLEMARLRGQIAPDADIAMIVELFAAAVTYRRLVLRRPVDRADAFRVVDAVLPELRPVSQRAAG